jgi:ankyrin repeat protein
MSKLHRAAKNGDIEKVCKLLDKGEDLEERDNWGMTPLQAAAMKGQTEIVKVLLSKGADVNAKVTDVMSPVHGKTPLDFAADGDHASTTELLRQHGGVE